MTDLAMITYLKDRIKELEDGACRFNCRTAKSAFMAGFDAGADDTENAGRIICPDFKREVTERAWQKFNGESNESS